MITEYNSETAEIVFGLAFFVATMTATLLPYMITCVSIKRREAKL
jgi:hypothetical protein